MVILLLCFILCSYCRFKKDSTQFNSQCTMLCYAEGTWRNFRSIHKNYLQFCSQLDFSPLPVSCETINGFAITTALHVKSSQTVSNYISGLKTLHSILQLPTDAFDDFSVPLTQ